MNTNNDEHLEKEFDFSKAIKNPYKEKLRESNTTSADPSENVKTQSTVSDNQKK